MIRVDVEDYCQNCLDFSSDVTRAEKVYAGDGEIILGDTIIQCKYRKRCASIVRFLTQQTKTEVEK